MPKFTVYNLDNESHPDCGHAADAYDAETAALKVYNEQYGEWDCADEANLYVEDADGAPAGTFACYTEMEPAFYTEESVDANRVPKDMRHLVETCEQS